MSAPIAILIHLAAITGPDVNYLGPQQFMDRAACEQALPQAERAVEAIIRDDPSSLSLFGYVTGPLTRAYRVSYAECLDRRGP